MGLFPGQGSQKVGMGKELADASETAREIFAMADKVLGFSLSSLCFEGPADRLTGTDIAQPAILTVSTICYQIARCTSDSRWELSSAAGHSLGEYSALVAAGAITFEDAVQLVHKRGRYMQEAVPVGVGKMVAVLGKEIEDIEKVIASISTGVISIANVNAPGQIVVAGHSGAIDEFVAAIGGKTMPLQVSAPFHCPLMKAAEENLRKDLKVLAINRGLFPVYANYSARPLTEPEEIRESLALQVCGRVRWTDCISNSVGDTGPDATIEFGAGNVLSGMMKRINPDIARLTVGSQTEAASLFC